VIFLRCLALYLLFINVISIILCVTDKLKSKLDGWRIPEKTLFITSLIGGSVGMYATMCLIRHKTKHKRFMIGLPIIIFIQCIVLLGLLYLIHATA